MIAFMATLAGPRRAPAESCARKPAGVMFAVALLLPLLFVLLGAGALAQLPLPDTAAPRRPIYNLGLDEFWIGGVLATKAPDAQPYGDVWNFLRDIGVKVIEIREHIADDYWHVDSLAAHAAADEWLIPNIAGILSRAGNGREAVFFPFDSAQSYYYRNEFVTRSGGDTARNFTVAPGGALEQVYDASTTTANQTVASGMAFGYVAGQKRWPTQPDTIGRTVDCSSFITNQIDGLQSPWHYITVTGHMFDPNIGGGDASVGNNTAVLVIEIWCEIPKGSTFQNANGQAESATNNVEYLFRSFNVLKKHLAPLAGPNPNFDLYRDTTFAVDMRTAPGTLRGGPYHANNSAHRFDIRVRWVGAEKVALRGVSLRDSIGWLLRANDAPCISHRNAIMNLARRFVNDSTQSPVAARRAIMRLYTGDEGKLFEHGPYAAIDSILNATVFGAGNDTLRGVRAYRAQNRHNNPVQHTLDDQPELAVELYPGDVWYRRGQSYQQFHGVSDIQLPSIAEHNGGRWLVPLMQPTPADVQRYERFMQRFHMGQYIVGPNSEFQYGVSFANELGHAAWSSRRTGKRLTIWPSTMSPFNIQPLYDTADHFLRADTTWTHILEAAELRAIVNLGLAYGARGVHYSWIGSDTEEVWAVDRNAHPSDTVQRWNFYNDFGPVGRLMTMQENRRDTFLIRRKPEPDNLGRPEARFLNFYTGWGNRLDEMRWLNKRWFPTIGLAMAHLHWRDGYSMHFLVPQAYMPDTVDGAIQTRSRALPATEIVRGIQALNRDGVADSAAETYVELGLFDTLKGVTHLADTMHIFVVNRRTFERPRDIPDTSALGRRLDSLAETRTLAIRFNIKHPVSDHYNMIRVREIAADTNRLPLSDMPRQGLDTVVYGDSTAMLTLRPGGAALLRITFCPPETALGPAELRRGSQKKMLYSGDRYYCTYVRRKTCKFPLNVPMNQRHPVTDDAVFLRRSFPMTDTTGAIQWEPIEWVISDTTNEVLFLQNRFPSLTLRNRGDSTIVSVVWTNYGGDSAGVGHRVNYRAVLSAGPTVLLAPIELVGIAHGRMDSTWGTPVASRLHGCDMIAWGDSLYGIMARARRLKAAWNAAGTYSPQADSVSLALPSSAYHGRFPSMPPFADIRSNDSNVAIVWEHNSPSPSIFYARLVHSHAGANDVVGARDVMRVSQPLAMAINPSVDQLQDVWHRLLDGVTWEEITPNHAGSTWWWETWVHFRSVRTPTTITPGTPDTIGVPDLGWESKRFAWYGDYSESMWSNQVFPNTSALNQEIDTAHQFEAPYFTVVHRYLAADVRHWPISLTLYRGMGNSEIRYGSQLFTPTPLRRYVQDGYRPSGASADVRLPLRYAGVYQMPPQPDTDRYSSIHTSRQFYAKDRPIGYVAEGREGLIHMSDTAPATYRFALHDVWASGAANAGPVAMRPWAYNASAAHPFGVADIGELRTLMCGGMFAAHDSTTIGCYVSGSFNGDTARAAGSAVTLVAELVDSASGTVVRRLDSFRLTPTAPLYANMVSADVDLLSGTYYVRLRVDTASMVLDSLASGSNVAATAMQWDVFDAPAAKIRRLDEGAARIRLAVRPNLVVSATSALFSVSGGGPVSLALFDATGRCARVILDRVEMEEGRYSLDVPVVGLAAGAYMLELRSGNSRAVAKLVVAQ